ncbi:hypothetical protein FSP39_003380, partial [Pinctada imbricata]
AIVIGYNLVLNEKLKLTREQIVGIYNGTYTYWNETTFQQTNPNSTMPNEKIIVVARADKSGTTDLFTGALSAFSSEWHDAYGQFSRGLDSDTDKPYNWNESVISYYGNQNRGVSGLILSFKYSIGYLSVADAKEAKIENALLENDAGYYVEATSGAVQNSMDYFATTTGNLTFSLHNGLGDSSYPIAGFTHFIAYRTQMQRCDSAKEFLRYTYWALTESTPISECENAGMAPLSSKMVNRVLEKVLKKVTCNGENVWSKVLYDIENEDKNVDNTWVIAVSVVATCLAIVVVALCVYIILQRYKQWKVLNRDDWNIPIEDIIFYFDTRHGSSAQRSKLAHMKSLRSIQSVGTISGSCAESYDELVSHVLQWPGKWRSYNIGLRLIDIKQFHTVNVNMKREMINIRDKIIHSNVVRFFGLTEIEKDRYIIGEYCAKGTLVDVLQDDKMNISNDFKLALTLDITIGMQFLHTQGIVHGNLTSSVCLVDSKWTVKVSDWEFSRLFLAMSEKSNPVLEFRKNIQDDINDTSKASRDFYVSPEMLRSDFTCQPTRENDVYSFAVIMHEVYTREEPYCEHYHLMSTKEILCRIQLNHLRPQPSIDIPISCRQVMEIAWTDNPTSRPSFDQITKMLKHSNPDRRSVVDSVMRSMEEYTDHLEDRVEEKSAELETSRSTIENLLSSLVPAQFALKLTKGHDMKSTNFPSVGIIVLDICDYQSILQGDSPEELVSSLNYFCAEVDLLQKKYNMYAQSISGNCSTLLVGVAQHEATTDEVALHTAHICMDIFNLFTRKTPPERDYRLSARIGAHIGNATAGVVGSNFPRFVVFGSVIDVSSALSRSATPAGPHISKVLWRTVEAMDIFTAERAGILTVKGTEYKTYLLTGRSEEFQSVPSEASDDSGLGGPRKQSVQSTTHKQSVEHNTFKPFLVEEKAACEPKKRPSTFVSHSKGAKDKYKRRKGRTSKVNPSNDDVIVEVDDI